MALTKVTSDIILDGTIANVDLASDIAVTGGQIADNAVTLAKMAGGTDGNLITYDTSGDPAYVATGTATHVLTSNGVDTAPTFQAATAGGFDSVEPIISSQSYTIPSDITKQVFYVTGGGGGGGGADVSLGSSAGSAGGTVIKSLSLAAGTTMDIVIGAAAAGGAQAAAGTIGVDTTVTQTGGTAFATLTAPGGKPGKYGYNGIASAVPSGGDINIGGGAGGSGGGGGGSSYWGGGGVSAYYSAAGAQNAGPGLAHGSGGGAGYPSNPAVRVAAAGAVGIVMIYLYK
mgnify:CR=1 FL=1